VPLLDEYLEFLAGRSRPNTVLGVAYDLKVFFTVVARPPRRVRPVEVLAFMTAQQQVDGVRSCGSGRQQHRDHRPGWAATAAVREARRPGPDCLVPASLGLRRGKLILTEPVSDGRKPSGRDWGPDL
jgi:hypothetical protein